MSPFSKQLQYLRKSRGFLQKGLANAIGCEPCYISHMECGIKGPPPEKFIQRINDALSLSQEEQDQLQLAADASVTKFFVPTDCDEEVYWLLRDLQLNLKDLMPMQIRLMRDIVNVKNGRELESRFLCHLSHEYSQENGAYG